MSPTTAFGRCCSPEHQCAIRVVAQSISKPTRQSKIELCATEVDTETGMVKIRSYVAVDDVGVVVNPLIVEGQVHGGIAQGIGQALYEEGV